MSDEDLWSIVSFNVNGLKSALRRTGFGSKTLPEFLESFVNDALVVCFQEVKMLRQELGYEHCKPAGWEAYYSLSGGSATATKRISGGYSGVATFCRSPNACPVDAREGLTWVLDRICQRVNEGRPVDKSHNSMHLQLSSSAKRRRVMLIDEDIEMMEEDDGQYHRGMLITEMEEIEKILSTDLCLTKHEIQLKVEQSHLISESSLMGSGVPGNCPNPVGMTTNRNSPIRCQDSLDHVGGISSNATFIKQLRELRQSAIKLDQEGRCLITHHGQLIIINVYCPALRYSTDSVFSGSEELDTFRLLAKSDFHKLLHLCIREIQLYSSSTSLPSLINSNIITCASMLNPIRVILVGDMNVKPFVEDSCDIKSWKYYQMAYPFIDQTKLLFSKCHMVDSFRHLHPHVTGAFSCWSQVTGSRVTNYGSRVDLIIISDNFISSTDDDNMSNSKLKESWLMPKVSGSDHCPIGARFTFHKCVFHPMCIPPPGLCAEYLPGASQRQVTLFETVKLIQKPKDLLKKKSTTARGKTCQRQLSLDHIGRFVTTSSDSSLSVSPFQSPIEIDLESHSKYSEFPIDVVDDNLHEGLRDSICKPLIEESHENERIDDGELGHNEELGLVDNVKTRDQLKTDCINHFNLKIEFNQDHIDNVFYIILLYRSKSSPAAFRRSQSNSNDAVSSTKSNCSLQLRIYVNVDDSETITAHSSIDDTIISFNWISETQTLVLRSPCDNILQRVSQNRSCFLLDLIRNSRSHGTPIAPSMSQIGNQSSSILGFVKVATVLNRASVMHYDLSIPSIDSVQVPNYRQTQILCQTLTEIGCRCGMFLVHSSDKLSMVNALLKCPSLRQTRLGDSIVIFIDVNSSVLFQIEEALVESKQKRDVSQNGRNTFGTSALIGTSTSMGTSTSLDTSITTPVDRGNREALSPIHEVGHESRVKQSFNDIKHSTSVLSEVGTSQEEIKSTQFNIVSQDNKEPIQRVVRGNLTEVDLIEKVKFLSEKEQKMYLDTARDSPLCNGHKLPCVKRRVKKPGPTQGKEFWSCVLPDGAKNDPNARCNTFMWAKFQSHQAPKWATSIKQQPSAS